MVVYLFDLFVVSVTCDWVVGVMRTSRNFKQCNGVISVNNIIALFRLNICIASVPNGILENFNTKLFGSFAVDGSESSSFSLWNEFFFHSRCHPKLTGSLP